MAAKRRDSQADSLRCGTAEVMDFRALKGWQRSHRLTLAVYNATGTFPREETCGLTAQLRRCADSIPANFTKECGRSGEVELARFMLIAMGSDSELEYHLLLARDLGYSDTQDHQELPLKASKKELQRRPAALRGRCRGGS